MTVLVIVMAVIPSGVGLVLLAELAKELAIPDSSCWWVIWDVGGVLRPLVPDTGEVMPS